jgi:predicted restriction endonuclease
MSRNWQGPCIQLKHAAAQPETEVIAVDIEGIGKANSADEALAGRISPAAFRDIVLAAYGRRCAITGKYIEVGSYLNLEAAHIRPVAHGGVNLPSNGIALSRDLHWAFDKGAFTLTTDGRVEVHPGIDEGELLSLKGSRISEPTAKFFAPSAEFVSYHRTHVFGLYLRSGQISAEGLGENF